MLSNLLSGVLSHLDAQVKVTAEQNKETVIGDDVITVRCCLCPCVCVHTYRTS